INVTPSGAVTLSTSSGNVTTIQSHGVSGTATVQAGLNSSSIHQVGWPFVAGQTTVTVTAPGPAGPPTGLAVGSVTDSSAHLTWIAGDNPATTTVQTRLSHSLEAGAWGTVGSVAAGVSAY